LKTHSLIVSLLSLKGNPRGCVLTEPIWGLAFSLYAPFVSVYMVSLGLSDKQIGLLVSIAFSLQIFMALISGVITDKMGRRNATLLFDILSWAVPALIWALAQNFWYFLAAAAVNSVWRVVHNSWICLMVEDAQPEQLVDIFVWVYIAGLLGAFFTPITGYLIATFSLVPTMRGLYLFAASAFTIKAMITYRMTHETQQGLVRMHATRHQSAITVLAEYRGVLRGLIHSPQTLYTAGIMLIMSICLMINGSFWAIIVTEKMHILPQYMAVFPSIKSIIMLLYFFVVLPRLSDMHFKVPMVVGFAGFVASQLVLISVPDNGYGLLLVSTILEACSLATINPLLGRLEVLTINAEERARIQSILYMGIIILTAPFGWIAGALSEVNKSLPFILNIGLFAVGGTLAYLAGQASQKRLVSGGSVIAASVDLPA
jgi:DHA1 family tetracycline resistance protein-like MFS transporter